MKTDSAVSRRRVLATAAVAGTLAALPRGVDRKSTRLNSSH